jgi:uncharacterized membrane protein
VRRRFALIALLAVILTWDAALVAAPSAAAPRLAALAYFAGSLVCHQQPARSFHRDGAQYPVCARCLGLYVGGLFGVFGWVVVAGAGARASHGAAKLIEPRVLRATLLVVAAPTLASVLLAWSGVWDASNTVRAMLALPLGAVITAVVAAVLAGDLR